MQRARPRTPPSLKDREVVRMEGSSSTTSMRPLSSFSVILYLQGKRYGKEGPGATVACHLDKALMASTILLAMESPRPVPLRFFVYRGSKIRSLCSGGMPGPCRGMIPPPSGHCERWRQAALPPSHGLALFKGDIRKTCSSCSASQGTSMTCGSRRKVIRTCWNASSSSAFNGPLEDGM